MWDSLPPVADTSAAAGMPSVVSGPVAAATHGIFDDPHPGAGTTGGNSSSAAPRREQLPAATYVGLHEFPAVSRRPLSASAHLSASAAAGIASRSASACSSSGGGGGEQPRMPPPLGGLSRCDAVHGGTAVEEAFCLSAPAPLGRSDASGRSASDAPSCGHGVRSPFMEGSHGALSESAGGGGSSPRRLPGAERRARIGASLPSLTSPPLSPPEPRSCSQSGSLGAYREQRAEPAQSGQPVGRQTVKNSASGSASPFLVPASSLPGDGVPGSRSRSQSQLVATAAAAAAAARDGDDDADGAAHPSPLPQGTRRLLQPHFNPFQQLDLQSCSQPPSHCASAERSVEEAPLPAPSAHESAVPSLEATVAPRPQPSLPMPAAADAAVVEAAQATAATSSVQQSAAASQRASQSPPERQPRGASTTGPGVRSPPFYAMTPPVASIAEDGKSAAVPATSTPSVAAASQSVVPGAGTNEEVAAATRHSASGLRTSTSHGSLYNELANSSTSARQNSGLADAISSGRLSPQLPQSQLRHAHVPSASSQHSTPQHAHRPPAAMPRSRSPSEVGDDLGNGSWRSAIVFGGGCGEGGDEHRMSFYQNNASMARSFYFRDGVVPPLSQRYAAVSPSASQLGSFAACGRGTSHVVLENSARGSPALQHSFQVPTDGLPPPPHPQQPMTSPSTQSLGNWLSPATHAVEPARHVDASPSHASEAAASPLSTAGLYGTGLARANAMVASPAASAVHTGMYAGSFGSPTLETSFFDARCASPAASVTSLPAPTASKTAGAAATAPSEFALPTATGTVSMDRSTAGTPPLQSRQVSSASVRSPAVSSQRANASQLQDAAAAFMRIMEEYQRFKGQCTEAYLTRIERTVDRFLVQHYSPPPNGSGRGGRTRLVGERILRLGSNLFRAATGGINSASQPPSAVHTPADTAPPAQPLSSALHPLSRAGADTAGSLSAGPHASHVAPGGTQASSQRGSAAANTVNPFADAATAATTAGNGVMGSDGVATDEYFSPTQSGASLQLPSGRQLQPQQGGRNAQTHTAERDGEGRAPSPTSPTSPPNSIAALHYTADVVPDDYIDQAPRDANLRSIRENYPILLHVLRHIIPPTQPAQPAPDSGRDATGAAPPARAASDSTPYDVQEHVALCDGLLLPTIEAIWGEYLHPLETHLRESMAQASTAVQPLLLSYLNDTLAHGAGSGLTGAAPTSPPYVTADGARRYERLYKSLQSDLEYITTIQSMDKEFVAAYDRERRALEEREKAGKDASAGGPRGTFLRGLRGAATGELSDYVPVYGLVMSRLHRLEMEHRTVLELYDRRG